MFIATKNAKKARIFLASWHFYMTEISLCERYHIWESVNSNAGLRGGVFIVLLIWDY